MAENDMTQKLMDMIQDVNQKQMEGIQEIRETVIKMNTNMQYSQQNQIELKQQIDDIQKKLENQNTKINNNTNNINVLTEKNSKIDKWWGIIGSTVVVSIITAVLTLVVKTH